MSRRTGARSGALLVVLLLGAAGQTARAEEPMLRGRVTALATDSSLAPRPGLTPWLNLGGVLQTPEAGAWQVGLDLSVHLGTQMRPAWSGGSDDPFPVVSDPASPGGGLRVVPGIRDNGTRLFVRYRPSSWSEREGISLTLHPLAATRLRLGWAFPTTWATRLSRSEAGSTGLQLQVQRESWSAFAAVKGAVGEGGGLLMPLVGAEVALPLGLRAEVQAASALGEPPCLSGLICGMTSAPLLGSPHGLSARLVHRVGEPIGLPVDFRMYGAAPELFDAALAAEHYPGGLSSSVSLEATRALLTARQNLLQEDRTRSTVERSIRGDMLALDARVRWERLRVHALALMRSPGALALNDRDLWRRLLSGTSKREVGVTLAADYHLPALGLTPGGVLRVVRPASVLATFTRVSMPDGTLHETADRSVLTPEGYGGFLPENVLPVPVVSAHATLKWEPLPWVSALGEVSYTWDPIAGQASTGSHFLLGSDAGPAPARGPGFHLLVQARF